MLTLLFAFKLCFISCLHPIHVSVTEIEFDEKDKALEIMMRIFIDDLEVALRQDQKDPVLDILNTQEKAVNEMMRAYFKNRFAIALDNKSQPVTLLGHERDGDVFVFYLEVSNVKKWREILVRNDVLMEVFDDQSNLVHVTARGKIRSMRLTKSNSSEKLTFDLK